MRKRLPRAERRGELGRGQRQAAEGSSMASVGFIGVGVMGREMVLNLLKAGHRVRLFDVRREAAEALQSAGAGVASSIADAVQDADVAVTMLPDTSHVQDVVLGPDGIVAHPPAGRVLIEMSTI